MAAKVDMLTNHGIISETLVSSLIHASHTLLVMAIQAVAHSTAITNAKMEARSKDIKSLNMVKEQQLKMLKQILLQMDHSKQLLMFMMTL